jgi:hypothetical protein
MRDLRGYKGLVIISPGGRRRLRDFQKLCENPKTGMVLLHDAAHDDIVAWPAASVGPGGEAGGLYHFGKWQPVLLAARSKLLGAAESGRLAGRPSRRRRERERPRSRSGVRAGASFFTVRGTMSGPRRSG